MYLSSMSAQLIGGKQFRNTIQNSLWMKKSLTFNGLDETFYNKVSICCAKMISLQKRTITNLEYQPLYVCFHFSYS